MAKSKSNIRKSFFDVVVPLTSTKVSLYGASIEDFNGKTVKLDLTRNLKGKSLEVSFRVKVEGESLVGEPTKLELISSFIRRMMRRGADYVEDSFVVECKDGKATVKPFMITRNRVSGAVRNALREEARKHLSSTFKVRTIKEIFSEIMANKVQKDLSFKLKKIYPLALCEIRVFELA